jgi:hypothetical protein
MKPMFILKLYDRLGNELKEGDIVKISDGRRWKFFAEVKYLKDEQVITPFHTFSFSSFERVDSLPDGVIKSTEERYGIWWLEGDDEEDPETFEEYLSSWRECEHHIDKRCWRIENVKSSTEQLKLF